MKHRNLTVLMAFVLAVISLFGLNASAAENGSQNDDINSVSAIKELVEQLVDEGEMESDQAVHSLKLHLMAVAHYEKVNKKEKVAKHMGGFNNLLDYQKKEGQISDSAYQELSTASDDLIAEVTALPIVIDGQANAVVVIAGDADSDTEDAADTLVEYVEKSTGVELAVTSSDELNDEDPVEGIEIYVGENNANEDADIDSALEDLDGDGFFIHPHDNRLTIIGPTSLGTQNGVYEFLKRFVGVRWLAPGEGDDWEHVPNKNDIAVPNADILEEPDFSFRSINMNSAGNEQHQVRKQWELHNQFQNPRQLQIGHNLYKLFAVEKFGDTNPEFYPGGNPPEPGETHGWQPCFTEEGTVDAAVDEIIDYFDNNPDKDSYSLAINDGGNSFCEDDPSHPDYPDKKNYMGLTDMSEIYYEWVNEVVGQVREEYPDKWFGLYAYNEVMDAPSFEIDSHVVPYITRDRMAWLDEGERDKDQQRLDEWNEVADHIGWYEGFYGFGYHLPRAYSHLLADNLQYAKEHNVTAVHADAVTSFSEFPRAWLLPQLLWDVNADVDTLLNDWYEAAVGPDAATDLKAYFDFWEDFWTVRIIGSDWFENNKSEKYIGRTDVSYLSLVTNEEIQQLRDLLESVLDKSETNEQKIRAQDILRQFELFEANVLTYPKKVDKLKNEAEAMNLLDTIENTLPDQVPYYQKIFDLIEDFKGNVLLDYPLSDRYKSEVSWSPRSPNKREALVDYLNDYESDAGTVTERLKEMEDNHDSEEVRIFASMTLTAAKMDPPDIVEGLPDSAWIDYQESDFYFNPNTDARIEIDSLASNQNAAWVSGKDRNWAIYLSFKDHLPEEDEWKLYAMVRAEPSEGAKADDPSFSYGVYSTDHEVPSSDEEDYVMKVSDIADGEYHTFEIPGTYSKPNARVDIWFNPRPDEDIQAIEGLYVDRIIAVKAEFVE